MTTFSVSGMRFKASLTGFVRATMDDGTLTEASMDCAYTDTFTTGVSANEANRGWRVKNYTLNAAASVVLDVYDFVGWNIGAGSGRDMLGQSMSPLEEIAAIIIRNENAVTSDGQLEIEPDSSNGWAPIGTHTSANGGALRGQGMLIKTQPHGTGFVVTDASSHRIKFTAVTNTVLFSIWILGRNDVEESSSSSSSVSSSSSCSSQSSSSWSSTSSSSSSCSSSQSSSCSSSVSSSQSMSSSSTSSCSISTSSVSSTSSSSWSSQSSSSSSISISSSSSSSCSVSSSSWSS